MPNYRVEDCEYLAVVSEWDRIGKAGGLVGNAYPLVNLTTKRVVEDPVREIPNPGAVFLTNRGELAAWAIIRVRPKTNEYFNGSSNIRDCSYIPGRFPRQLNEPEEIPEAAMLLEVADFDPINKPEPIRYPGFNVTPLFFVLTKKGEVFGPLKRTQVNRTDMATLESIRWEPADDRHMINVFSLDELLQSGLQLVTYTHPDPELNEVIREPIRLLIGAIQRTASPKVLDMLPDTQLADWYRKLNVVPELPDDLYKHFPQAMEGFHEADAEVIRQRFARLRKIFNQVGVFHAEQSELARAYLKTEAGQAQIARRVTDEVNHRAKEIEREVREKQTELAEEKSRLERESEELRLQHQEKTAALEADREKLRQKIKQLEGAEDALSDTIRDKLDGLGEKLSQEFPLFAAVTAGMRPRSAAEPTTNSGPPSEGMHAAPLPAEPSRELDELHDEADLIDRVAASMAAEKLRYSREFLANVYVALKSSALNLIIGPPGYGKSTLISAMARALGHENAMLEIAVRRSWSDDRYLLGFYDAFHGRYDPGPTGLVHKLIQAEADWEQFQRGLYFVLLDEFNLASPEYYFSQLLQVSVRGPDVASLRLFDPTTVRGGSSFPDKVTLYPNVRFWGTINYDETTERLSPRVLDRTGMIFLGSPDVVQSAAVEAAAEDRPSPGIRAGDLFGRHRRTEDECPDDLWALVQPQLDLLRSAKEDWGAGIELSPRVHKEIQRYLANSIGVLDGPRAADFVFQQRVLPVLRGRGEAFEKRITALQRQLAEAGFTRSARHVSEALARAAQNFGDLDFLAYS